MGLIKKYQTSNQMNYSFDSNNKSQQKLTKRRADQNINGVSPSNNFQSDYLSNGFQPIENTFNQEQSSNLSNQQSQSIGNLGLSASMFKTKPLTNPDGSPKLNSKGEQKQGVDASINKQAMALAAIKGAADYQRVNNDPNSTMQQRMDQTSNSVSGVVGAMNPIIGMAIAAGNMIAKPIQAKAEQRNENGSFKNFERANNTAVAGAFFDPMQAFAARKELAKSGDKSAWTTLDMKKYTKLKEKQGTDAYKKVQEENAKIAEAKRVYNVQNEDQQKYTNILNATKSFNKGGKLIPRFRRGGPLDLEKENIILDGPSHDDHNSTGVKGDKGLPVVKGKTKIAEIESLELILNKEASQELEKLIKQYKQTGDNNILVKIGKLTKSEINDNTYDYSKELLK
jgi:hypothetical protein